MGIHPAASSYLLTLSDNIGRNPQRAAALTLQAACLLHQVAARRATSSASIPVTASKNWRAALQLQGGHRLY